MLGEHRRRAVRESSCILGAWLAEFASNSSTNNRYAHPTNAKAAPCALSFAIVSKAFFHDLHAIVALAL